MSVPKLLDNIKNEINTMLTLFISTISKKYNLDEKELHSLLESSPSSNTVSSLTSSLIDMDLTPEKLYKASKSDLVAMCRANSKKITGTKQELIDRLLNKES